MAPANAQAFIEGGAVCLDAARRALAHVEANPAALGPAGETILFDRGSVRLKAPVPRPRKFIAAGKNYRAHQQEMSRPGFAPNEPKLPIAHVQFASTVVGPDETVPIPKETRHMDYEVELAVVIGRRAVNVSKAEARGFVFGYTVFNDLTDRDMYRGEYDEGGAIGCLGKNFAGFSPLGPVLVTPDEIGDPYQLALRSRVNGEIRQDGSVGLLMYNIEDQIAHWSGIGLDPGDMLGTGTPGGVAAGRKPDQPSWWLKKGDVVECEIDRIGVLRTTIG
jgi:acylpyruvate hydrolase